MDWIYKERVLPGYNEAIIDDYRRFIQLAHQVVKKGTINITNKTSIRLTKDELIIYATPEDFPCWLYDMYYKMGLVHYDLVLMKNSFETMMSIMHFMEDKELDIQLYGMKDGLREESYQLRKNAIADLVDAFQGEVNIEGYPNLITDRTLLFVELKASTSSQETLTISGTSQMEVMEQDAQPWPITRLSLHYQGENGAYFLQHARKRMKALFALDNDSYMAIVTKK